MLKAQKELARRWRRADRIPMHAGRQHDEMNAQHIPGGVSEVHGADQAIRHGDTAYIVSVAVVRPQLAVVYTILTISSSWLTLTSVQLCLLVFQYLTRTAASHAFTIQSSKALGRPQA